ncbi:MAG TPA: cupin domain-containing protein [Methylocella sp.]|nr:cupin domain-containing protein [Methylocella sp.]
MPEMPDPIIAAPGSAEFRLSPIPSDWIISGEPEARCTELARSRDQTTYLVAWECTPGQFHWYYDQDEIAVIHTGELFIRSNECDERRVTAGDIVYFRAGTSYTWRVTQTVRKVAFLRIGLPMWLGLSFKVWDKIRHITGLASPPPMVASAEMIYPSPPPKG